MRRQDAARSTWIRTTGTYTYYLNFIRKLLDGLDGKLLKRIARRSLPNSVNAVTVKVSVNAKDGNILGLCLCNQHPIERIFVPASQ
jgi:hypothetical protein